MVTSTSYLPSWRPPCLRSPLKPLPRYPRAHEKKGADAIAALPAVQGLLARGVRASVRTHALDQGQVQTLRALLAARGPHARHDLREALDAHAPVVRGGHESARRSGGLSIYAGLAAWAWGGGRGRRTGRIGGV